MTTQSRNTTRRGFLKSSTGLAVGASLASVFATPTFVHAGVDEKIRVGLIGCGQRGTKAAVDALLASSDNVLTALGDTFQDAADASLATLQKNQQIKGRVQVNGDHVFVGFDAYKHVIDSGVDVVLLTAPTHFRPSHLAYAVEAGKHCFVEKPVAVDPSGIRSIIDTCNLAKQKGLSIVSGLCWRYHPAVQETVSRIVEDNAIGDIVSIQSCYNSGQLWHRGDSKDWSRMEYQVRNWIYFTWLSGDHICEQAVHSLDKSAWLQGDTNPIRAFALGGRQQRTQPKFGDVYDHFAVSYEFPNDVRVFFTCRQQDGCANSVDEVVLGTRGRAWILKNRIDGENPWRYSGPDANMYHLEHKALFDSIRDGRPVNDGHYMANSNMIGIMGRMCAYSGQTLTWDQCFNSNYRLGPKEYAWTDEVPEPQVPIPGVTKVPVA